jgi:hypothetical protein
MLEWLYQIGSRQVSTIHQIASQSSQPTKVMLRMDRRFRERGLRTYRGYAQHGERYARLQFDNQTIEVGVFGDLRRMMQ